MGWLSALGWQAVIAGGCFSTSALTLQLVSFNIPSYVPQNWHITLMMYVYAGNWARPSGLAAENLVGN